MNTLSLRSQDTVTVRFRSRFPCWGCALCVHREGRSLSDGLPPKLSSTGSSPLPVMCGAMALSCGKSCPTEKGLTGTWPIKMYVFKWSIVIIGFFYLLWTVFSLFNSLLFKQCLILYIQFLLPEFHYSLKLLRDPFCHCICFPLAKHRLSHMGFIWKSPTLTTER